MNKDSSLRTEELKLVLLICGDAKTGKKTIVKNIIQGKEYTEKEQPTFKSYFFTHQETINKTSITIPVEIRILNSEELESELKINKSFFAEALGAFVVNSIKDENSFTNGEKWKDKIDLMCCLPNRFPLPVFLLINKCDEEENKINNKEKIESYSLENQFFNTFLIGNNENNENNINTINEANNIKTSNNENIKDLIVEANVPFKEMVKIIMGFKDIKNRFIAQNGGMVDDDDDNAQQNKKKNCVIF